jgi:hypothetical protein
MVSLGFFSVAGQNDLPFLETSGDLARSSATPSAASELCRNCLELFERDAPTTHQGGARAACAEACSKKAAEDPYRDAFAEGYERPYASPGS